MTEARVRLESVGESVGLSFKFFSREYAIRMGFVLFLFAVFSFTNCFFSCLAGYRNPNIDILGPQWATGTTTLPDIGHDIIGWFCSRYTSKDYIDWFELPDIFVQILGISMGTHIFLHPRRFLILRRFLFLFSCLLFLRSFTVIITSLPDASPECAKQFLVNGSYKDHPEDAVVKSFWRALNMMQRPQDYITCGDMVFSGHTSFLSLCMLVFNQYCRHFRFSFVFRHTIYVLYGCSLVAIIGTKLHYTLDVALAILITVTLWRVYHTAIRSNKIKNQYRILQWLEAEVVLEVDREALDRWYEKKRKRKRLAQAQKNK